jgi:hypothetical protein
MDKNYVPVEMEPLREFVHARMKVFHEEALDVPLVLFDDVLDHVLRIDRIFKQNQGHVLLIGVVGACFWISCLVAPNFGPFSFVWWVLVHRAHPRHTASSG